MKITLANGTTLVIDKDEPIENPKAAATRWLEEYRERRSDTKPTPKEQKEEPGG